MMLRSCMLRSFFNSFPLADSGSRFLRARRFQVQDAFKQFKDTEDWRKATQLDQLYETIDVEQYNETRKLVRHFTLLPALPEYILTDLSWQYPQWTGRRDRRGIPVYVYEVRHLNSKTMAAYEKSAVHTHSKAQGDGQTPAKLLRLFALYENLIRFVMPLCTALTDREYPETPITQSNNIVDISGVGLKQFWNLRTHMQDASTLATAHYPETLDRIFVGIVIYGFKSSLLTALCNRLSEPLHSSQPFGVGSSGGSTPSRHPRSSYSANTICKARYESLLIPQTYQRNLEGT
jgi:hypothetical protein